MLFLHYYIILGLSVNYNYLVIILIEIARLDRILFPYKVA